MYHGESGFICCAVVNHYVYSSFFIMIKFMPPEHDAIEGGKELIKRNLIN